MGDGLQIIGLDYLLFALASLTVVAGLHVWLRRRRHVQRFPVLLWLLAGAVLPSGAFLVRAEEDEVHEHVKSMLDAMAPTYAEELKALGHARINEDIPAEKWVRILTWRRARMIGYVGLFEALSIVFSCLFILLREEIAKRRRAQLKLRGYRRHLQQQVKERSAELLEAQRQALQSEKLASLGQLAAGVAHEINTPIQYVGDNLRAISDFIRELVGLTAQYQALVQVVKTGAPAGDLIGRIEQAEVDSELDYIREDAPKAVAQGLEGVQRVTHIVRAMKDFSHLDRGQVGMVEVNAALARTLTLTRNEYKYVADVETDFADVPDIEAYGAELNQVFLNIIVNAAHAIADTGKRGTITVRTRLFGEQVEVAIADTGKGIPAEIQGKIFDPFFTTKAIGKGTGQGLNIAHQIISKHGGTIRFESQVGKGTTFFMRLPVMLAKEEPGEDGLGVGQGSGFGT